MRTGGLDPVFARSRCVKIAIVTDAWRPQTNGVVQTLRTTADNLCALRTRGAGDRARSVPHVSVPDVSGDSPRLVPVSASRPTCSRSLIPTRFISRRKARSAPRRARWCVRRGQPFTTSYHTQFPEYVRARAPIPLALSYAHLRRFHSAARAHDGRHARDAAPARVAQLPQHRALDARRGRVVVRTARQILPRPFQGPSRCTSGASRSKKTSRRFCRSTCGEPRSSSATGRRASGSRRVTRT